MKTLILGLLLLTSATYAQTFEPQKGDFAVYQRSSNNFSYQTKRMIESLDGRFGNMQYIVANFQRNKDSDPWVKQGTTVAYDPATKNTYFTDVKAACPVLNGAIETITTGLGTLEVCKVIETIGMQFTVTSYFGANTPFGIIKQIVVKQTEPQNPITIELISSGRAL